MIGRRDSVKIGIMELLVVFIVALFALGPDKLPLYARKLGEALAQFRKFSEEATKDIRESIVEPLEEAQRPLREAMEPVSELEKSVRRDVKDLKKSLNDIARPVRAGEETPKSDASGEGPVEETTQAQTDAPDAKAPGNEASQEQADAPQDETSREQANASDNL